MSDDVRLRFATGIETNRQPCAYCGMLHQSTCPRIKAIEYWPDGRTKRVEFHESPKLDLEALAALRKQPSGGY